MGTWKTAIGTARISSQSPERRVPTADAGKPLHKTIEHFRPDIITA
jgi:hypothetical protein